MPPTVKDDELCPEVHETLPFSPAFARVFLSTFWQKRPVLLRGALAGWTPPIDADELAGLACVDEDEEEEEEEEGSNDEAESAEVAFSAPPSRLILRAGGARPWELRRGPFAAAELSRLPDDGSWTLVVNGVDRRVPELADSLLPRFFGDGAAVVASPLLPSWRLDDVQVSYAASAGATVGAHVDSYDVFLCQSGGGKRWRLAPALPGPPRLVAGVNISLLEDFAPMQEFDVLDGDVLYLPPGVQHEGVSLAQGFTFSVGFLSPTLAELASRAAAAAAAAAAPVPPRWRDPEEPEGTSQNNGGTLSDPPTHRPGTLRRAEVAAALSACFAAVSAPGAAASALGCSATAPREGTSFPPIPLPRLPPWDWVASQAADAGRILRHEGSRFAYLPPFADDSGGGGGGGAVLFAGGEARFALPPCPPPRDGGSGGEGAASVSMRLAAEVAACASISWERCLRIGLPPSEDAAATEEQRDAAEMLRELLRDGLLYIPGEEEEEEGDDEGEEEEDEFGGVQEIDLEDVGAEAPSAALRSRR